MVWAEPQTPEWPESAFRPPARKRPSRAKSGGQAGDGAPLLRESKERHHAESKRFGNAVLNTYLLAPTYTDYRGPCFKARTAGDWRKPPR